MAGDPFEALGLEARFDLTAAAIDRAYFARSAGLHPDLAAGDADAPRRMAELNEARRVLSDPERRADALLVRLGGPTRTAHKGLAPGFLAEIMEVREQIEQAGAAADPQEREALRQRWERWAEQERGRAIAEVAELFSALGPRPMPDDLKAIRTRLNAWRYVERLIEQLDPDYDPAAADFRES